MHAELVRRTGSEVDVKVVNGGRMHVLQWRRRLLFDEVLLDGKRQSVSYGLWGREKVYGLVFGRYEMGDGGERIMMIIDPRWDGTLTANQQNISGLRLETLDGPLLAYGSLDPKSLEKPSNFTDWIKRNIGMDW